MSAKRVGFGLAGAATMLAGAVPVAGMALVLMAVLMMVGGGGSNSISTAAPPGPAINPVAQVCDIPTGTYSGAAAPGINITQTGHAWTILQVARKDGMGERAAQIAISVALAESTLLNIPNAGTSQLRGWFSDGRRHLTDAERATARESLQYPNDSNPFGDNLDSIGLFQQRPSTGWGNPKDLITPAIATEKFLQRLRTIPDWNTTVTPWRAGQAVQQSPSSDGGIYERTYRQAQTIVAHLISNAPSASTSRSSAASTSASASTPTRPASSAATPSGTQLSGAQLTAAREIISTAIRRHITARGVKIALTTALAESGLDPAARSGARSGLFLQLPNPATPTAADPTQAAGAAEIFFNQLVDDYPTYESDPASDQQIAEKLQRHPLPVYARWAPTAQGIQRTLTTESSAPAQSPCAAPATGGQQATTSGATVTIPDHPNAAAALRGKSIPTPNAKVAKGIAAGLSWLGAPYVWGGGGDGAGPTDGCSRGQGQLNSCQNLTGFDCSGLSAYVIVQAGYPSPGGNSSAQANPAHAVPWSSGEAGDLVLFTGHVAVYLGVIDGVEYILQASTVGVPIEVVPLTRTRGRLQDLYRYWT